MKTRINRLLAFLTVFMMVFNMVPVSALADPETTESDPVTIVKPKGNSTSGGAADLSLTVNFNETGMDFENVYAVFKAARVEYTNNSGFDSGDVYYYEKVSSGTSDSVTINAPTVNFGTGSLAGKWILPDEYDTANVKSFSSSAEDISGGKTAYLVKIDGTAIENEITAATPLQQDAAVGDYKLTSVETDTNTYNFDYVPRDVKVEIRFEDAEGNSVQPEILGNKKYYLYVITNDGSNNYTNFVSSTGAPSFQTPLSFGSGVNTYTYSEFYDGATAAYGYLPANTTTVHLYKSPGAQNDENIIKFQNDWTYTEIVTDTVVDGYQFTRGRDRREGCIYRNKGAPVQV